MSVLKSDTIAALATPPGRSSVAMFRVSGGDAFSICDRILRHKTRCSGHRSQTLHRALVVDGKDIVDDVFVGVFHAPRTYTGEDIIEITCHGGSVPIRRILSLLLAKGARQAEGGEFTLRAYLNGKLDLAQAEAVCDTINAQTDEGFRLAQAQQAGRLSQEVNALRSQLLGIVARIEANIDFPEDVGEFPEAWCASELANLNAAIEKLIESSRRGILYRDGISVVLAGPPNAGKSSLLNALLRADRAIVTPIAGTTRDSIEESITIRGIVVRLADTAGLRETGDAVERLGVERTRKLMEFADIILCVQDASAPSDFEWPAASLTKRILVWNKGDLCVAASRHPGVFVSALTGAGIMELEDAIAEVALEGVAAAEDSENVVVTHTRHAAALHEAHLAVERAKSALENKEPLDFLSIDAHAALAALGKITGETAPQEIIHEIFHRFCIGK